LFQKVKAQRGLKVTKRTVRPKHVVLSNFIVEQIIAENSRFLWLFTQFQKFNNKATVTCKKR